MDIRIETPGSARRAEDEDYIYAPIGRSDDGEYGEDAMGWETMGSHDAPANMDGAASPEPAGARETQIPVGVVDGIPLDTEMNMEDAVRGTNDGSIGGSESTQIDGREAVNDEPQQASETVSLEEYRMLEDRLARLMSDWENYRRRTSAEVEAARENANRNMAEALIPTLDHFGYALSHAGESQNAASNPAWNDMVSGFSAIYRALLEALEREGLELVSPTAGEPFDLNAHQAIERNTSTDYAPDTIVSVMQPGYKFKEYVIRPALVSVAG